MIETRTNAAIAAEVKTAREATREASASLLDARINRPERIAEWQRAYADAKRAEQECEARATAEREAKRTAKSRRDVHRHMARRIAAGVE